MATENITPKNNWTLAKHATVAMRGSVSCQYDNLEYAITSTATAPAATLEGHFVAQRHTEPVTLSAGARLWTRLAPNRSSTTGGEPVGVLTLENA